MNVPRDDNDELLEVLLSGTPDRLVDSLGSELRGEIASSRAALAALGLALTPVAPPAHLRAAVEARINARPFRPRKTVLAVMDMIEDYLTPGRPLFVPRALGIIPALRARIEKAHRDREPVVFLCDQHEADDPELEVWPLHAIAGTSGCSVMPELGRNGNDVIVPHRTYSAFVASEFDEILKKLGANSIVLTGCATDLGMLATATDALMRGYTVEVPDELQAGSSAEAERFALATMRAMRPLQPLTQR